MQAQYLSALRIQKMMMIVLPVFTLQNSNEFGVYREKCK